MLSNRPPAGERSPAEREEHRERVEETGETEGLDGHRHGESHISFLWMSHPESGRG